MEWNDTVTQDANNDLNDIVDKTIEEKRADNKDMSHNINIKAAYNDGKAIVDNEQKKYL